MPFFEVDDDALGELDETIKSKLKPYEPEDVAGLKNKANQLLAENKSYKSKLEELQRSVPSEKPQESGSEADKLRKMLEDSEKQRKAKEDEIASIQDNMRRARIRSEAEKMAAQATSDPEKAEMLVERFERQLGLDGNNLIVLDAGGNPTVSTVQELASTMKAKYPFLYDGSKAAGGGAKGNSGGAGGGNKTMTNQQWQSSSPNERMTFIREGGVISG